MRLVSRSGSPSTLTCLRRIHGGVYCNEPVVGYDILATVLDLAAPASRCQKVSRVEAGSRVLQKGGAGKVERPLDRLVFHMAVEVEHPQSALRKGDLKLMHYWDTKEDFLYDLTDDPGESRNLAREKPEVTSQLLKSSRTTSVPAWANRPLRRSSAVRCAAVGSSRGKEETSHEEAPTVVRDGRIPIADTFKLRWDRLGNDYYRESGWRSSMWSDASRESPDLPHSLQSWKTVEWPLTGAEHVASRAIS